MSALRIANLALLALPLSAQAWDFRLEVPFPKGQSLPLTLIQGTGQLAQGGLDTGKGTILSVNHRILRLGPVLRLDWGLEFTRFNADGAIDLGAGSMNSVQHLPGAFRSKLDQVGLGAGIHATFNVPFTGLAGEMGLIQRFQSYRFEGAGARTEQNLSRTWLRVGGRFTLPMPLLNPYVCASYQQPVSRDKPVQISRAQDILTYLNAQGSGQEFERVWTFGVGIAF
jgi:hypothetical protein